MSEPGQLSVEGTTRWGRGLSTYDDSGSLSPYDDGSELSPCAGSMDVISLRNLATIARGRRRDLGLSQAELAAKARVSRQWVSEFEGGKATAEVGLMLRLFDALDLRMTITEADASTVAGGPGTVDLDALLREHGAA